MLVAGKGVSDVSASGLQKLSYALLVALVLYVAFTGAT
jgi:hypothetical protein